MNSRKSFASVALIFASTLTNVTALPALATTIINDPFTDGGVSNGVDPQDSAWTGSAALSVANDGVIGSGNAMIVNSGATATFQNVVTSFDTITLDGPREKLKLQFDLKLTNISNTADGIRFGFRDPSSGSPVDQYFARFDTGTANDVDLARSGTGTFGGGSQITIVTDDNGSPLASANQRHFGSFSVQRTDAGRIDLRARLDTRVIAGADTTGIYTTFDQTGFQTGSSQNQDFNVDNFRVTRWTNRFDDTFEVGAVPSAGNDLYDPNDTAWVSVPGTPAPTLSIVSDDGAGGIGSNSALNVDNTTAGGTRSFKTDFDRIALNETGDTVSLSFDFRRTTDTIDPAAASGNRGLRFGLYDSLDTSGTTNDDEGYRVDIGVDRLFAELRQEAAGNTILGGGNPSFGDVVPGGSSSAFGIVNTDAHFMELLIERVTSGLEFTFSVDGDVIFNTIDTSGLFTSFDQLGFSNGGIQYDFLLDNVVIDFQDIVVVPEPATATLSLLALGGMMLGRRRLA